MALIVHRVPKNLIMIAKYKWEFLRRNRKYIEDWKQIQNVKGGRQAEFLFLDPWNDEVESSCDLLPEYTEKEIAFCKKWEIGALYSPDWSWEDLHSVRFVITDDIPKAIEQIETRKNHFELQQELPDCLSNDTKLGKLIERFIERRVYDTLNPSFCQNRTISIIEGFNKRDIDKDHIGTFPSERLRTGKILIEVDLNYSKSRLMDEFKYLIDEWKKNYKHVDEQIKFFQFCSEYNLESDTIDVNFKKKFQEEYNKYKKLRDKKYQGKYHFENFDLYLQVYDLRKEGKSWSEITKSLRLNSIQTARNHYKAAMKIVNEGVAFYVK